MTAMPIVDGAAALYGENFGGSYESIRGVPCPAESAKTDHKAQPDTSNLDHAEMECQDSEAGDGITHQDKEWNDGISRGKGDCDFSSPPSNSLAQPTPQRRPHKRKLPPLPKEDFKVIEVADISRKMTDLTLNGRLHAVKAYAAVGNGTRKGVINDNTPNTSTDTLLANLRIRTQGVDILRTRTLGETRTAAITFLGAITPRFVYYMGGEVPCYPFKCTIQFCYACEQTGHITDGCPTPHSAVCHRCGMKEPQPYRPCNPVCSTCGEGHLTRKKEYKQRFKQPVRQQQPKLHDQKTNKQVQRAEFSSPPKPRWYSSEDADDEEWPQLKNQADIPERKRHEQKPRPR
ncbi:hypothetical protein HPB52_002461 [Rhipicephalus sanguineus]|uniref:CCHC-type domain-containing protein n=1 Tax=Rhipicephalus sanguineus TaxID=34632 RepID=A0A9D4Q6T8_RHISA|nr:hypothetical protein HPB52_002461 [Rhipicephalus sanguineus]